MALVLGLWGAWRLYWVYSFQVGVASKILLGFEGFFDGPVFRLLVTSINILKTGSRVPPALIRAALPYMTNPNFAIEERSSAALSHDLVASADFTNQNMEGPRRPPYDLQGISTTGFGV